MSSNDELVKGEQLNNSPEEDLEEVQEKSEELPPDPEQEKE